MDNPLVGILMGSDSDLSVMKETGKVLDELGIDYEMTIVSAHRTPESVVDYVTQCESRGIEVIIAGAGGAAHLPGIVAALTLLPVIGVPIFTSALHGLDSLLSIVQMPGGIPVATVGINGARNAGILAGEILGVKYPRVREELKRYRQRLKEEVKSKAQALENMGWERYLKEREGQ